MALSQSEKRLLWHPRHKTRFAVGGGAQITLYEWMPDPAEIKQVTARQDLSLMKCFAWSPDPAIGDLIAVGLSSGRVNLLRLEATSHSRDHVLSAGPSVSLPLRNSRSCNSLAFSTANPNYLAVGLDKVRGDHSLVIWDVQTATPQLTLKTTSAPLSDSASSIPVRLNSHLQIPRVEPAPPARLDQRIMQQHAPTEAVSSIAFLPNSPNRLVAGESNRWLRLYDLRNPKSVPMTVATKAHAVVTDPYDDNRIGSLGDGVVTIWDARSLGQPLLTFTERDATADGARIRLGAEFHEVEFSGTRRGILATLEKDAYHVRFWDLRQADIVEADSPDRTRSRDSSQSSRALGPWPNASRILPWSGPSITASQAPASVPAGSAPSFNLVLSDTRKTKHFARPLASFALVPSQDAHPLTSNVMVVNKDGDLELYAVHDAPKAIPWSARGDLVISLGPSYRILPGIHDDSPPPEPWEIPILPSQSDSKAHSIITYPEGDQMGTRGRSSRSPAPLFGRGDEDGFPALPAKPATNLAATRPGRSRTYSPAALRHLPFEHNSLSRKDIPAVPQQSSTSRTVEGLVMNGGHHRGRHSHSRHIRESSFARKPVPESTTQHAIEEDISMTMRRRVIRGYGLTSLLHNAMIVQEHPHREPTLAEVWHWLDHSQRLLSDPTPRLDGYNFAYHGLLGIWEGFRPSQAHVSSSTHTTPRVIKRSLLPNTPIAMPTTLPIDSNSAPSSRPSSRRRIPKHQAGVSEDFLFGITAILERHEIDLTSWKPAAITTKLPQRQLALQLCGWSLTESDLALALKRWEKEHRYSQAACWLVFTDQSGRAMEVLMRSNDESLHVMSGMLAALSPTSGAPAKNHELMKHCERLIVRMQDPYLRAMLTYLTVGDWSEVLQEEALPLRERLAIAFQFLEDKELSSYLRRVSDRCCHDGDIEGLIVTGLAPTGIDIVQAYVDVTGDVQTAAILSSLSPTSTYDSRTGRWLDVYRDLLDGWKLFHHRCQFDIDRGRALQDAVQHAEIAPFEWAPRQILIRCNYCNKAMDPPYTESESLRATACPHCNRPLPRCAVCLMTLSIVQDVSRSTSVVRTGIRDTIDEALVFCQTCRHGGHASHILHWFYGDDVSGCHAACPVAGCDCRCADEL